MIDRVCTECCEPLRGVHFNRRTCEGCRADRTRRLTRKSKKTTLASDALTCPVCKARMNVITAGHYRSHGFKEASEFKEAHRLPTLTAPSLCAKQSAFMSQNNPTKGKPRTKAERKAMSQKRLGKGVGVAGKYVRTKAIRDRISEGVAAHHLSNVGNFTRGAFHYSEKAGKALFLRSSWEVRVLAVLEKHPCVEVLMAEPFVIPYVLNGQSRRYVPDFLVTLEGGVKEVWEIKPRAFYDWPKNQAKFKALNEYVAQRGWNARLVGLAAIEGMERQVGILPWIGEGGPWVDLNDTDYRPTSPKTQRGLT